jgi:hypothetical protein
MSGKVPNTGTVGQQAEEGGEVMAKDTTRKELKAAEAELDRVCRKDRKAGRKGETDAYLDANDKVSGLLDGMPWWKTL